MVASADGVALALIGVLEMLWQDFAFQSETHIDRAAARRRCLNFLRSVFPQHFGRAPITSERIATPTQPATSAADFISAALSNGAALVMRGDDGAIRAFRLDGQLQLVWKPA